MRQKIKTVLKLLTLVLIGILALYTVAAFTPEGQASYALAIPVFAGPFVLLGLLVLWVAYITYPTLSRSLTGRGRIASSAKPDRMEALAFGLIAWLSLLANVSGLLLIWWFIYVGGPNAGQERHIFGRGNLYMDMQVGILLLLVGASLSIANDIGSKHFAKTLKASKKQIKQILHSRYTVPTTILLVVLVGCIAVYQHHQATLLRVDQQRYNGIGQSQEGFGQTVIQLLGANRTFLAGYNTCNELHGVAVPSGNVWCTTSDGMANVQPANAKSTALEIEDIAKSATYASGLTVTTGSTHSSIHTYGLNGSIDIADTYFLDEQAGRCDVHIDTPFTTDNPNNSQYKVRSLEFSFGCYLRLSEKLSAVQN